jgi:hypothetical protein
MPRPKTGSSSRPSSPVIEKSNFRLCSSCWVVNLKTRPRLDESTHQLSHGLFRLDLSENLDTKSAEVDRQIGIHLGIVTDVAVDVCRQHESDSGVITVHRELTRGALGCDRA